MKPTIFMLCGLPGSGKTTYAKENLVSNDTAYFSSDEWVIKLFGNNFDPNDYVQNEKEAKQQIKKAVQNEIKKGKNIILDFGFWKKVERKQYYQWAEKIGAKPALYYFTVPFDEMVKRLEKRNGKNKGDSLVVTKEMLEKFVNQFEIPNKGETILFATFLN